MGIRQFLRRWFLTPEPLPSEPAPSMLEYTELRPELRSPSQPMTVAPVANAPRKLARKAAKKPAKRRAKKA